MDEVGLMVTYIRSDGTLSFGTVGGIDPSVIIGRQVRIGQNRISGVVGSTAVHNLSKDEREKAPETDSLYIDIGAASKEEAEKYVSLGNLLIRNLLP
jgi:endoglucanase